MKRYEWGLTDLYNHKLFTPIIMNETHCQVNAKQTELVRSFILDVVFYLEIILHILDI